MDGADQFMLVGVLLVLVLIVAGVVLAVLTA